MRFASAAAAHRGGRDHGGGAFPRALIRPLLALLFLAVAGGFAQTPAGPPPEIVNQAQASYTNQQGGDVQLTSNTVRALFAPAAAVFRITKTASDPTPDPGQEVTFGIAATQKSGATPTGLEVFIDGQSRTLFLLRDAIPPKTVFARFASGNVPGATLLFHASGNPLHQYATVPPDDLRRVDAVALGFLAMPASGPATMRFIVRVAQTANGPIDNTAQLYAIESPSATASVTISNTVRIIAKPPADPFGIVFDSKKNTPVAGTRVTLVDTASGQPAQVFKQDGSSAPNSVITGADGHYSFPVLAPGSYRLEVFPPPGYTTPSKVAAGQLPAGRTVDASASYGLTFVFDPSSGRMRFDIPADRLESGTGLFVQKVVSRDSAEIGDFVDYTVRVRNVSGRQLTDVILDDRLPHGFVFVADSARLNGARLRSASGERGPRLKFSLGALETDGTATVTYRTRLGPDAPQGDGINRALARNLGVPALESNVASAVVRIVEGVFTTRGIILGKVFVDTNRNRVQDAGEIGVPGIRLYLEDGSYVVTDGEGKYSFYGVTPRTHVLKLDKLTLPVGAKLGVLDTRNAGTAGSRFVELKNSELHKANFAIVDPTPAVLERIEALRTASAKLAGEGERSLKTDLQRDDVRRSDADRRSLPSSGIVQPGVAVQPTQDQRTESAGSLILNDARMQFAPTITRGKYGEPLIPNLPKPQGSAPMGNDGAGPGIAGRAGILPAEPGILPGSPNGIRASVPPPSPGVTPEAQAGNHAPIPAEAARRIPATAGGTPALPDATSSAGAAFDPLLPADPGTQPADLLLFDAGNLPPGATVPTVGLAAAAAQTSPSIPIAAGALAFLDFQDGDTLPMAQATIRVQGKSGGRLRLNVNGEEVPERRAGKRVTMTDRGLEAVEYIGVPLRAGENTLALTQLDSFGNVRGSQTIRVIAPDKLGVIKIELPSRERPADGNTPTRAIIHLLDAASVPVTARTELTLEASLGLWNVEDLNRDLPGVQVFIEGGRAEFSVQPPIEPGDCRLRVSSGVLVAEETISFLPDLRPMIAAGVVEGRVNISHLSAGSLTRLEKHDTFEQELREFSVGGDERSASARTAFFVKGKIKGSYLLTAAYDSERETKERLFRDIQPDEFYPVYGDASTKGFEAQSTGPLYVRIDNKKSYLLYGDFTTQGSNDFRQLGTYSRSLTGVKEHFENARVSANAWATYDSTKQVIEEVRANGTSGPYLFSLRSANALSNSERVEVIVRDRSNSGLIIKTESRTRFADYELEPFTGRVLFKSPVPSLDENLNPVSIRVTYEADQGGPKFWTYGADAQVKVAERFEVGGSYVREENPLSRFSLYSTNAVYQLGKSTFLVGEWARTEDVLLGGGNAYRAELRHLGENMAARLFWGRAESSFHNPAATLQSGRTEGGAQIALRLGKKTRLLIEGVDNAAEEGGARRGLMAAIEQTLAKDVRLEIGGRYSREDGGAANATSALTPGASPNEVRSARVKLTVPMPWTTGAGRLFAEYEQDLFDSEKRTAALGGDYQLDAKTRLYARHELISTLGGPFDLNSVQRQNTTIVGVESTYAKDAQLFNEFRARNGISGREAETAVGLRNTWPLAPGLRAQTSFERISPVALRQSEPAPERMVEQQESTAVTGALEYTDNPDWKGTARLELRTSQQTDSLLNTLGIAWKVNRDWTFLGKTILYLTDQKTENAADQTQARFQAGFAWRPETTDRWNGLMKYEFKTEDGVLSTGSLGSSFDDTGKLSSTARQVHIISLDVNFQPTADLTMSGHYAGKLATEDAAAGDASTSAQLLAGRVIYDLTRKWDIGLNASALFSEGGLRYGLGPEIGYTLRDNLRAGVGYNFIGYTDRDLSEDQYTQQGVYLALRWKFDEETFQPRRREEEGK